MVYGDIGTSPLYAMRQCFFGTHSVPPTHENVLGVLSLIIYALLLVVSLKYVAIVLRADNQGEGGILALTALIPSRRGVQQGNERVAVGRPLLVALGIFGTALLYGDGMITPAISVLGATEGLEVATPFFSPYVVPITVAILIALFVIQKYGTHRIGGLFGPIVIVWFVSIAALGIVWILRVPAVIGAVDPRHAIAFFRANGLTGFAVLGAVFLVVTGGEALYADMGHFGRQPIRLAWFALVLPALLLNYLGQGALMLLDSTAARQPFFLMAPSWALLPLVGIATAAAVIASQALISGSFSLTRQAIQLGYAPRLDVEHTSAYVVMTERWKWPKAIAMTVTAIFLIIDVAFLGANLLKVVQGGWLPLAIAAFIFTLMTTWKTGRRLVAERLNERAFPLVDFMAAVNVTPPRRVPGTAVFMTAQQTGTPPALAHNLRYNKILHEHVIVLTVGTAQTPHIADNDRLAIEHLGHGVFNVRVQYGFMEDPDVPAALAQAREQGLVLTEEDLVYFLGRETIIVTRRKGMAIWREKLFVLMARNAVRATAFFRLPPDRVVELGVQVEM